MSDSCFWCTGLHSMVQASVAYSVYARLSKECVGYRYWYIDFHYVLTSLHIHEIIDFSSSSSVCIKGKRTIHSQSMAAICQGDNIPVHIFFCTDLLWVNRFGPKHGLRERHCYHVHISNVDSRAYAYAFVKRAPSEKRSMGFSL